MNTSTHHYFLLNYSPWPSILSLSSFNLMISLFFFFKYSDFFSFLFSLVMVSFFAFFWWVNFSFESNLEGKHSTNMESGVKMSMILFISSEVFFFFSFFWSYFHYFLSPTLELGLGWPPVLVESFDFMGVPLINTLLLMSSGITVTVSHYYIMKGKNFMSMLWLLLTILLGMTFTYFQFMEYKNSFFSISDSSFGGSFFVLTGFHGIHVLIGSIFLLTTLIRSVYLNSSTSSFLSFELSSWYWHFVDVVWIFLYFFLYYMIS